MGARLLSSSSSSSSASAAPSTASPRTAAAAARPAGRRMRMGAGARAARPAVHGRRGAAPSARAGGASACCRDRRRVAAAAEAGDGAEGVAVEQEQTEEEKLRAAERFMVIDLGEADCSKCGYHYFPKKGDPEYPIAPGTQFSALPGDWLCPLCGAPKVAFRATTKEVAGFAENQGYGFGTNSMSAGEKNGLIYGSLGFFFALFLAGYLLG